MVKYPLLFKAIQKCVSMIILENVIYMSYKTELVPVDEILLLQSPQSTQTTALHV
jgi:hypothetical protein